MCHDLSMFEVLDELQNSSTFITIPDGTKLQITHVRTVRYLSLTGVLYVPHFHFYLVSIPKLCHDLDCSAVFTDSKCFLQGPSMRQLHLSSLKKGLYYLNDDLLHSSNNNSLSSVAGTVSTDSMVSFKAKLWHIRLGHLPFSQHKHLSVFHDDHKSCHVDDICQICPMARQTRLSFSTSSIKSSSPFQLLYLEIWGPYHIVTHNGCKSFLTIVDDFTRMTWVHMLTFKSDVSQIFAQFVNFVATQFHASVKAVKTDNAKELCEGSIKHFYLDKGIEHFKSCNHTPQQNGVVERKHRHLLETSRALYFQSKLTNQFWDVCVLTAAHIINRMPLSVLGFISPYQRLYNQQPNLDRLKAFGCLCFVTTPKVHRHKFSPRAEPHVFVGYSPGQKGYKVLNLNTLKIQVSRDVVFHEQHFPFHISQSSSTSSQSFQFFLPIAIDFTPFIDIDIPDIFQLHSSSPSSDIDSPLSHSSSDNHNSSVICIFTFFFFST
ncbi:Retrovirus-related Pol polyprotein from transposon RE1 [Bienertia sinuspersici]